MHGDDEPHLYIGPVSIERRTAKQATNRKAITKHTLKVHQHGPRTQAIQSNAKSPIFTTRLGASQKMHSNHPPTPTLPFAPSFSRQKKYHSINSIKRSLPTPTLTNAKDATRSSTSTLTSTLVTDTAPASERTPAYSLPQPHSPNLPSFLCASHSSYQTLLALPPCPRPQQHPMHSGGKMRNSDSAS